VRQALWGWLCDELRNAILLNAMTGCQLVVVTPVLKEAVVVIAMTMTAAPASTWQSVDERAHQ